MKFYIVTLTFLLYNSQAQSAAQESDLSKINFLDQKIRQEKEHAEDVHAHPVFNQTALSNTKKPLTKDQQTQTDDTLS